MKDMALLYLLRRMVTGEALRYLKNLWHRPTRTAEHRNLFSPNLRFNLAAAAAVTEVDPVTAVAHRKDPQPRQVTEEPKANKEEARTDRSRKFKDLRLLPVATAADRANQMADNGRYHRLHQAAVTEQQVYKVSKEEEDMAEQHNLRHQPRDRFRLPAATEVDRINRRPDSNTVVSRKGQFTCRRQSHLAQITVVDRASKAAEVEVEVEATATQVNRRPHLQGLPFLPAVTEVDRAKAHLALVTLQLP